MAQYKEIVRFIECMKRKDRPVTAEELAQSLGLSVRTIYRYKREVNQAGGDYYIYGERSPGGGFYLYFNGDTGVK